ncbi:TetR family transcriptional regulator [Flexivirga sp. ID2601S]|uniref:TetR family transcriptional regulator n=1 Tax=Flexivirga aerilata TaxID=1656889 RepID=A0A849AB87_9MICO|nr:TetR family transcriptional regulator [Flexivirga aerilata]NNG37785.1 TetR family transcriptional regulator [Flexivirga aerilata]
MDIVATTKGDRRGPKFQARRQQLAQAALVTLAELGYARTSLREIAHNSEFSHGVVHYYFSDKADLITECVASFRELSTDAYADILAEPMTAEQFRAAVVERVSERVSTGWPYHRIWYDLRTQSMFDDALRDDVQSLFSMFYDTTWKIVSRYAELAGTKPAVGPELSYSMSDGLVQRAVSRYIHGDTEAIPALRRGANSLFDIIVPLNDHS